MIYAHGWCFVVLCCGTDQCLPLNFHCPHPMRRKKGDHGMLTIHLYLCSFSCPFLQHQTLWTLLLSNHYADSLQIKLIGTILACRCAMVWSFTHQGHMGVPMGIRIRAPRIFRTLELSNHWAIHSKSNSLELLWPVDMQRHLPIGVTWACSWT